MVVAYKWDYTHIWKQINRFWKSTANNLVVAEIETLSFVLTREIFELYSISPNTRLSPSSQRRIFVDR